MQTQSSGLNTAEFAAVARTLAMTSRGLGLVAPGFRCPPRIVGVDRTLRRFGNESRDGIVAVVVKGRPLAAIVADMIEGVVVLNRLVAADATRVRSALWQSLEQAPLDAHVA